jgi:uncharacterized protein involved in outer membrane biogenesis
MLQLTLGSELLLRIGELRVLNPPGFEAQEFLAVGDASVRIGLFDALRGQVRLRGIEARDISLWLERATDGRGNWDLTPPREPAAPRAAIDLGRIQLTWPFATTICARRREAPLTWTSWKAAWGRINRCS